LLNNNANNDMAMHGRQTVSALNVVLELLVTVNN